MLWKQSVYGVCAEGPAINRWRKEEVKHINGVGQKMSNKVVRNFLKWFRLIKHMSGQRLTKSVHKHQLERESERQAFYEMTGRNENDVRCVVTRVERCISNAHG